MVLAKTAPQSAVLKIAQNFLAPHCTANTPNNNYAQFSHG